jgi:hypothetical protein
LSLDDIKDAQGVPLLAELCPEIIEHLPAGGAGQPKDDIKRAHPFGEISAAALQRQCSTWVNVERDSDRKPDYRDRWSNSLRWNQEHPQNYTVGQFPWPTGEEGPEAASGSAASASSIDAISPFPSHSSCSGHPKEAEDISRCFVAQLQRRLDFPYGIRDDRPCINKLVVGCSNERLAALRPQDDEVKGQQKHVPRRVGTWVMGDQTQVEGNWLAPKIFTDFGGPYDCATGASMAARTADDLPPHGMCYGKLLEYWVS